MVRDLESKQAMCIRVGEVSRSSDHATQFFSAWASPAMRGIQSLMAEIASTDIPVLILGETGSGKEAVATQIHRLSARRDGPLTKVRCSALSAGELDLLVRPAGNNREGNSPEAPGTVLLDEIAELGLICQAELLGIFSSPNATSDGCVPDAWVVATTCQDLEMEVRAGSFREDLCYRIGGITLRLPPLRQRREDIPVLTEFFLNRYAWLLGRERPTLSAEARGVLQGCSWPGNIRQLENTAKKIVVLGDERPALADIEPSLNRPQTHGYSLKQAARAASRQAERELILSALGRTRWNRKRAARELQISYKALLYKLKQIGLDDSAA